MNPQLSATRFRSIRNRPPGSARQSIRNYPQPRRPESATGATGKQKELNL